MTKRRYTWDEFFDSINKLSEQLKNKKYDSILVVTRGGLFPAAILAQKLDIRVIETIGLRSYMAQQKHVVQVTKNANFGSLGKNVLVVDDICDTGESLQYVMDKYKADSAVLFYKPSKARVKPTFYVQETDSWIVFPWEEDNGK